LNQKIDDLTDDDDDDEAGKEKVDINAAINGFINHFIPKPAGTPTALAPPVVQGVSANPREAQTDLQAALQKLKNRFPNKRLSAVINHFITLSNSPLYKALIDTEIAKL
jgi:hypothetical protein